MKTLTTKLPPRRRRPSVHRPAPEFFWVRHPNAELDRSGDRLLADLKKLRSEAPIRAHSI